VLHKGNRIPPGGVKQDLSVMSDPVLNMVAPTRECHVPSPPRAVDLESFSGALGIQRPFMPDIIDEQR
jgi:hypothetical protein